MNTEKAEFTFEKAFEIQKSQLQEWANKLNKETYLELAKYVKTCNNIGYIEPYSVLRGNSLDNYIANYKPLMQTKYDADRRFKGKYLICYKEDGEILGYTNSFKDAQKVIRNYEKLEKIEGLFKENCYEIQLNGNYVNS